MSSGVPLLQREDGSQVGLSHHQALVDATYVGAVGGVNQCSEGSHRDVRWVGLRVEGRQSKPASLCRVSARGFGAQHSISRRHRWASPPQLRSALCGTPPRRTKTKVRVCSQDYTEACNQDRESSLCSPNLVLNRLEGWPPAAEASEGGDAGTETSPYMEMAGRDWSTSLSLSSVSGPSAVLSPRSPPFDRALDG